MDNALWLMIGLFALTFLFILPSWTGVVPSLAIDSASLVNDSMTFSATYSVPWKKACYAVVYGPFAYDKPGHEKGNNIYVFTNQQGRLVDTLKLQPGASLDSLKMELWCDNDRLKSAEVPL